MSTRTRIGFQRAEFQLAGHPTFTVEFNGLSFTCFVLPLSLCEELPDFAMQMVADDREASTPPDEAALFGVCETIAEKFRPFVVRHEMLEYWTGCQCVESATHEIDAIAHSDLSPMEQADYLIMRFRFFERLVPYAERHQYSAEKIAQFRASLEAFRRAL